MSVTNCVELTNSREATQGEDGFYSYVRTWLVETNDSSDDPVEIVTYASIPVWGSAYPTDSIARAYNRSAKIMDGQTQKWYVTVSYSTKPLAIQGLQGGTQIVDPGTGDVAEFDPTDPPESRNGIVDAALRPWTLKVSSRQTERFVYKGLDGKGITNSAGQRIAGFSIPVSIPTFTMSGYSTLGMTALFGKKLRFENSVNEFTYMGCDPCTLRCTSFNYEAQWEKNTWVYPVTIEFEYNPRGVWEPVQVLDEGTMQALPVPALGGDKMRYPILDGTNNPITDPVCLDGDGKALSQAELDLILGGVGDFHYREFAAYYQEPWGDFLTP